MTTASDDRIRERAHAIWIAEGRPAGRATEHWLQAERELGADPVDGPVAGDRTARDPHAGPDETVETIGHPPKSSIMTLIEPDPDAVRTPG